MQPPECESSRSKTIWILSAGRVGDLKQMRTVAERLGGEVIVKPLSFRKKPFWVPIGLLPYFLKKAAHAALVGPAPDMVLSAEYKASAVALYLRRKMPSIKTICFTRPRGRCDLFDLIVTTPQYGLPAAKNTLEIALPLTAPALVPPPANQAVRRRIVLFVGGASEPYLFNPAIAADMCGRVKKFCAEQQALLMCSSSSRTGRDVEAVLSRHFSDSAQLFLWTQAGVENPYRDYLAQADAFIVTADSVSMVADALATHKLVMIYDLPQHFTRWQSFVQKLWNKQLNKPDTIAGQLARRVFDWGLAEPRANRAALYKQLASRGMVSMFGETPAVTTLYHPEDDMRQVLARIHAL